MNFEFNRSPNDEFGVRTHFIESGDPAVRIQLIGALRSGVYEMVAHINGKSFGFAAGIDGRISDRQPDGSATWYIDDVCRKVSRIKSSPEQHPIDERIITYTNSYKFADVVEQQGVLGLFSEAMSAYNGNLFSEEFLPSRVVFSETLLARIRSGEFIEGD